MNMDDQEVLDELESLPGWQAFRSEFAVPPASHAAIDRAGSNLRAVIAADARASAGQSSRRRRRVGRLTALAVAAAVATFFAISAPTLTTPISEPTATASAAQFLTDLASTTAPTNTASFDYWQVDLVAGSRLEPQSPSPLGNRTAIWRGRHGGLWISINGGKVVFENLPATFDLGSLQTVTWAELDSLRNDGPGTVSLVLKRASAGGFFDAAGSLLASAPLTQIQRQALLNGLATQPDLTLTRNVSDTRGRLGASVSKTQDPVTTSLIFDKNGTLLEVVHIANQPLTVATGRVEKGDVINYQTYLSAEPTDQAPRLP